MKIMLAKLGLDGHTRGAKVIARALKDAGHEVLYTGLLSTVDKAVKVASDEDVDMIAVSILSGAHLDIAEELKVKLESMSMGNLPLVFGGIIPEEDSNKLREMGVKAVFTPGKSLKEIIATIEAIDHECVT